MSAAACGAPRTARVLLAGSTLYCGDTLIDCLPFRHVWQTLRKAPKRQQEHEQGTLAPDRKTGRP